MTATVLCIHRTTDATSGAFKSCLDCDLMASWKYSTACGSFMSAMNMTLGGKHVSTRVVLLLSCAQSVGLPALQGIDTSCEQSLPAEPLLLRRPTNSPHRRQLPSQSKSDGKGRVLESHCGMFAHWCAFRGVNTVGDHVLLVGTIHELP